MKVFRSLEEIKDIGKTVVALGNFDGVHVGHQTLIDMAVRTAKEKGLKSAVFTFSNHPKNVISGTNVVKNIIYEDEKLDILEKLGIDYVFSLDFDSVIMNMSPDDFVTKLMIGVFRADTAVCGFNFTFGSRAAGTAEYLSENADRFGISVRVIGSVDMDGKAVSSTLIREEILNGNMEEVSKLLGRNYTIRGTVVRGNAIGRTLGFPTANITIDETMVSPPNGVYITRCAVGGKARNSVTNVGNKPTIGDDQGKNIETFIFDFDQEVYGEVIQVEFISMLRPEKKFPGLEELREQLRRDAEDAREHHGRAR